MFPGMPDHDRPFDVKLNERLVHEISLSFWCPHLRPWPARMTEARAIHGDDTMAGASEGARQGEPEKAGCSCDQYLQRWLRCCAPSPTRPIFVDC